MSFKPMNTADGSTAFEKTLLCAHAGWGKTHQAKNFQAVYGKGFIISGESGLSSVRSAAIDYLPFSSFDGPHNPDAGVFSFKGICRLMMTDEFKEAGYKWLMLDSLTELSDLVMKEVKEEAERKAAGKPVNNFALWDDYRATSLGACKWIRDLPYHVAVTCLLKEEQDDNGVMNYWPMVAGNAVQKQLTGIFDNVLVGARKTEVVGDERIIHRYIITDEVGGYHGKVRDEARVIKAVERMDDVAALLKRKQDAISN